MCKRHRVKKLFKACSICVRLSDAFSGAATTPFSQEIIQVLMSPINETDVEIKPDGIDKNISCEYF